MALNSHNKRAVVITTHLPVLSHVKSVMNQFDIMIHTEYDSLSSVKAIKRSIGETANTVFIRKAFVRLVNDWGLPALILLDYRIDLGFNSASDPDQRKLLRTFFISYLIMSQKAEFSHLRANFILIADSHDLQEARVFENDPIKILDILGTANDAINNLMRSLKDDPERFKRIFQVRIVPMERVQDDLEKTVQALLKKPAPGNGLRAPRTDDEKTDQTAARVSKKPADSTPPAALVAFLVDEKNAFINNQPADMGKNEFLKALSQRQFYIIGRCESRNQHDVAVIIRQAIRDGIGGTLLTRDDEIVINFDTNCTIDSTAISLLTGLFSNDLAKFKNKTINVCFKNACILEKSTGYIVIKKYIRHTY